MARQDNLVERRSTAERDGKVSGWGAKYLCKQ